jgi:hypothetical protein
VLTVQAPVATALLVLLLRKLPLPFLYFCPLEDDLDLEKEVEEKRRS